MQEIKDLLKQAGCTRDEIEVATQAITNINGDHIEIYRHINALCKASDDLAHTKSLIAQLGMTGSTGKRPYVRKQKIVIVDDGHGNPEPSLIEKSGVAAAHEALKEQAPQPDPTKKRQQRKKESEAEIKANVDALTGGVKLTPEEAAANLTIDL